MPSLLSVSVLYLLPSEATNFSWVVALTNSGFSFLIGKLAPPKSGQAAVFQWEFSVFARGEVLLSYGLFSTQDLDLPLPLGDY
jgi:hypothetical protein